jgi:ATPase subunit of ABC transporter with duplicated ATPase domains
LLAILDSLPQAAIVVSHSRNLLRATTTRGLRLCNGRLEPWDA